MQYGDHGTLGEVINDGTFKRNEKIYNRVFQALGDQASPEAVTRYIFRQIVEGLKYLHLTLKIAHRDIKPENIVYCTEKGGGLW